VNHDHSIGDHRVTALSDASPSQPSNAIEAVRHHHPASFYASIAGRAPWYDDGLGMWIIASPEDIVIVLNSDAARVRPVGEPCPRHLVGTMAGDTFQRIARMNDGAPHTEIRSTINAWFASLTAPRIDAACQEATVDVRTHTKSEPTLNDWMTFYPSAVMVRLMGMNPAAAPSMAHAAKALADAFGPGAGQETTSAADQAILAIVDALDEPRKAMASGAAGFLFQTFDATAALIGNTVAFLARNPPIGRTSEDVDAAMAAVLVNDLPVQNTRRFVHVDVTIGGVSIEAGSTMLLVLAAAATSGPGTVPPSDVAAVPIAFGAGSHRCPADQLAPTISRHAVNEIVASFGSAPLPIPVGYEPRQNSRIPIFDTDTARP
jgi:cytochrome P450